MPDETRWSFEGHELAYRYGEMLYSEICRTADSLSVGGRVTLEHVRDAARVVDESRPVWIERAEADDD